MGLKEKALQKMAGAGMAELPKQLEKLNELLGSMHAYMERLDDKVMSVDNRLKDIRNDLKDIKDVKEADALTDYDN